ncbi:hypothetical protein GCM10027347_29560 [Larkinella harenae]
MEQRNPAQYATVLSADLGEEGNYDDNLKHVLWSLRASTTAVLDGFVITGGNATVGSPSGGGIRIDGGSPTIRNCHFTGNRAIIGGAVAVYGYEVYSPAPLFVNCIFSNNYSSYQGGAVYSFASGDAYATPVFTNCTFFANTNSNTTSGVTLATAGLSGHVNTVLTNCILWNSGGLKAISNDPGTTVTIQHSLVEQETVFTDGGSNLINQNPLFVDAASTNLRLSACSPAINAGLNAANTLVRDLAGQNRVQQNTIDLGAFETVKPLTPDLHNGQTSVTITQGTPNVVLTAPNCSGELSWLRTNPLMSGTGPITVPTDALATYVYTAVCKIGTCVSAPASLTVTIVPPGQQPEPPVVSGKFDGYLDKVECGSFRGWAWNQDQPNAPVTLEFFANGQSIGTTSASIYRQDLKDAGKGNGAHAYNLTTPQSLKNGQSYTITAKVQNSDFVLKWGHKTLNCGNGNPNPTPNPDPNPSPNPPLSGDFDGYLDKVECGSFRGWAWDANQPNTPVTIEFFADGQSLGTIPANIFRQDILDAGKGNGKHVYFFPTPHQLKDGQPHVISAKIANTNYTLKWAPKSLTCPSGSRLTIPSAEIPQPWKVTILGNPVTGDELEVEVKEAQNRQLRFQLTNLNGQVVADQWLKISQPKQQAHLPIGQQPAGLYLLRITDQQHVKTIKVLKR